MNLLRLYFSFWIYLCCEFIYVLFCILIYVSTYPFTYLFIHLFVTYLDIYIHILAYSQHGRVILNHLFRPIDFPVLCTSLVRGKGGKASSGAAYKNLATHRDPCHRWCDRRHCHHQNHCRQKPSYPLENMSHMSWKWITWILAKKHKSQCYSWACLEIYLASPAMCLARQPAQVWKGNAMAPGKKEEPQLPLNPSLYRHAPQRVTPTRIWIKCGLSVSGFKKYHETSSRAVLPNTVLLKIEI